MAASKPTAIHFTLIFFVVVTLILAVVVFMTLGRNTELEKAYVDVDKKFNDGQNQVRRALEQIEYLKTLSGHSFETVGAPGGNDANTVIGGIEADIAKAGPLAQQTVSATILKLVEEVRNVTGQRDQLKTDLDEEHKQLLAARGQYQVLVAEQQKGRGDAEKTLADEQQTNSEQVAQKDKDIDELRAANTEIQVEKDQLQETFDKTVKQLEQRLANLGKINIRLQEELAQIKKDSFDRPDGFVNYVDNTSRLVWITLGEADRLPVRTSFSVYNKNHSGVARGSEDIKGSIEVTRLIGPHLAEARIIKDDIYNPLAPGDPIFTPLWSPGRAESFSIIGKMDLDGDGTDDRELLNEILSTAGARIDNDVNLKGERKGTGITVNTKFLVMGEIPDLASENRAPQQKIIQDINNHLKDMRTEARESGVRIISLGDFISYMGFKPQNRLFRPGDDRPYALKSGSRSSMVGETLGQRQSAGKTADVFSGDKKLRPKTSTGQTSNLFRGGGKAAAGGGY